MNVRAIEAEDLGQAEALLRRGFPMHPAGFWHDRLEELQAYRNRAGVGPIGSLLSIRGEDVGVLLTIENVAAATPRTNLSSWFVEDRARLVAARMLQRAVSGIGVYTDLTPTAGVRALNERLGIMPVRVGSFLAPAIPDALLPGTARVRDFSGAEHDALPSPQRLLLADHAALGLHAVVLHTRAGDIPLVLMRTMFRRFPGARVIYAPSRTELRRHRGAIARYLLSRGLMFLEVEANRHETWPGALFAPSRAAVFAKGPIDPDGIDHSYSELAFLYSH